MKTDFVFSRTPEIVFGPGKSKLLPGLIRQRGQRALLVTGAASYRKSPHFAELQGDLESAGIHVAHAMVSGEPSPAFVDETVDRWRQEKVDCVVSIGGGSAVDAGKAISAMLPQDGSVIDFLEGFERRRHDGRKCPFIAVPTSSGTGAEATKNAVLSQVGPGGFKSSLRHDNLVPDVALIDPELMLSCPPAVTAACGLDALTQLLESYVSSKASPMSDALALSGLQHVAAGFVGAVGNGADDLDARAHMAYGALLSGITLANAGLGLVHGFAGPIGGLYPVPHGVVCGTLLAEATRATIACMRAHPERFTVPLHKYATAGALLSGMPASSMETDCARLVDTLEAWIALGNVPRLGRYGITPADLDRILDKSNNKNSPLALDRETMRAVLAARL